MGRARANGYDLGVEFMHADAAFRMTMVEQISHIEQYKLSSVHCRRTSIKR
ncbi:MAG TPA: hypothetical protein VHK27_15500 [Gammaproteobacteria bacterium]|nr:hypothetical protein [Gammaproteobacteria bacterium]